MKPVWLLDVDGVINAIARKGDPNVWPADKWKSVVCEAQGAFFPILYSQEVIDFINSISDKVEVRWHTTWQEWAVNSLAPKLGLNRFEIAYAPEFSLRHYMYNNWWKLPCAKLVLSEENRPLIWTDDDINYYARNKDIIDIKTRNSLLISPNDCIGLTLKQLKKIEKFIEGNLQD